MDKERFLSSLERDGVALAEAAEGNFDAGVPACPDWKVRDLVEHTGEVHRFWGQIAESRLRDYHDAERVPVPPEPELLDWYRTGLDHLVDVLREADPSTEVWSWSSQKNVAFIQRRMAQETAVHRWDAQRARGSAQPIEPALAVDGVDEFFFIHAPAEDEPLAGSGETIHLHSTDADGEWFVTLKPDGMEVEHDHQKGDVAVKGSASDLLLLLWRRVGPSDVEVFGDADLLDRFLGWSNLD